MEVYPVPTQFRPTRNFVFPNHQKGEQIEEYAARVLPTLGIRTSLTYLPVLWTNYFLQHAWGKHLGEISEFFRPLDARKKYFTISQWDDGLEMKHTGTLHFSAGGSDGVPIPLICDYRESAKFTEPEFLASFVGSIFGRSRARENMFRLMGSRPRICIGEPTPNPEDFCRIMSRSQFSLCPSGYGGTSFRLYEAIQAGSIPVYIYDEKKGPWLPMQGDLEWSSFCVLRKSTELEGLYEYLDGMSQEVIDGMRKRLKEVAPLFTLQGTCEYIQRYLERGYPESTTLT